MKKCIYVFITLLCMNVTYLYADSTDYPTIIHDYSTYWYRVPDRIDVSDAKRWTFLYRLENGMEEVCLYGVLQGDSVVNDKTYVPVAFTSNKCQRDTLYYRQDGEKVYCLPKDNAEEVLILDYSLIQGDSFTDMTGTTYRVTEILTIYDLDVDSAMYFRFKGESSPKVLHLISEDGLKEDIWIEGIGSAHWGIFPIKLASNLKTFTSELLYEQIYSTNNGYYKDGEEDLCWAFNANAETIKKHFAQAERKDDATLGVSAEFIGNALHVHGVISAYAHRLFQPFIATCYIDSDNKISLRYQLFAGKDYPNCSSNYEIDYTIPGFAPGTYKINGQYFVCPETDDVRGISVEKHDGRYYDIKGRQVQTLGRGLFIHDGVKMIIQ